MDPELSRFDPFSSQTGFGRGRHFRPPPCYMRNPGRSATTRRPCWPNFTANRSRTRSDRAGESDVGHHGGSPIFLFFRPFQADPYPPSPHFWTLNSFPGSFSSDSSPFKRYDENKFGRLLDRVFRPPQHPLDRGRGTDVFLVSWAFR